MGWRLVVACVGALLATRAMAGEWQLDTDGYGPFYFSGIEASSELGAWTRGAFGRDSGKS